MWPSLGGHPRGNHCAGQGVRYMHVTHHWHHRRPMHAGGGDAASKGRVREDAAGASHRLINRKHKIPVSPVYPAMPVAHPPTIERKVRLWDEKSVMSRTGGQGGGE